MTIMKTNNNNIFFISIFFTWFILNLILIYSVDNLTRLNASADVASWLEPAKSIFFTNSFFYNTEYANQAIYRSPIIPIILGFSFKFADNFSFTPFVLFQITAAGLTSLILLKMIEDKPTILKVFLISTFLFNPNLISSIHLVQSEIFTMFFFICSFYFVFGYLKNQNKLRNSILSGIFLGIAILTRPSIIFLLFILPLVFYTCQCSGLYDFFRIKKKYLNLFHGIISILVGIIVMFPWANFVKSIEGEYSITAAETRYRFVWDQAIYATALSKNISYNKALLESEYQERNKKNYQLCNNEKNNSITRAKCFNKLTSEGYIVFFDNRLLGHLKALLRSIFQFFLAGGGQNFTNLIQPIKDENIDDKKWVSQPHKNIMLFNDGNQFAFISTIITVTYAAIMRIFGLLGVIFLFIRKEYSTLILILGVLSYFSVIHIYHGSSRYRVPVEPVLAYLSMYGFYFLNKVKIKRFF